MTVAEKGGQWLFSCYAPYKEKPAFPGFEDTSPEEIRLSYYEAQKNGNIAQYVKHTFNTIFYRCECFFFYFRPSIYKDFFKVPY